MRKILIAAAAGLMTLSALPVAANAATAASQVRPYNSAPANGPQRPDQQRYEPPRPGQMRPDQHRPDHGGPMTPGRGDDQYGRWDAGWGARPAGPPRHFSRQNDWYRHVRACSQRYRSYDARTDRYVVRRGQTAICRL